MTDLRIGIAESMISRFGYTSANLYEGILSDFDAELFPAIREELSKLTETELVSVLTSIGNKFGEALRNFDTNEIKDDFTAVDMFKLMGLEVIMETIDALLNSGTN